MLKNDLTSDNYNKKGRKCKIKFAPLDFAWYKLIFYKYRP